MCPMPWNLQRDRGFGALGYASQATGGPRCTFPHRALPKMAISWHQGENGYSIYFVVFVVDGLRQLLMIIECSLHCLGGICPRRCCNDVFFGFCNDVFFGSWPSSL